MENDLKAQIEEARANGYTDEDIAKYFQSQVASAAPVPEPEPGKRTNEYLGMGAAGLGKAAEIGGTGAAAYYGGKKAIQAVGQAMGRAPYTPPPAAPVAPPAAAPTTFTGGANPAWDAALSQPHPSTVPPEAPTSGNFISRMSALAKQYAPVAARAATGVGAMLYSPELNPGEDEWARQNRAKQDEARRLGLTR